MAKAACFQLLPYFLLNVSFQYISINARACDKEKRRQRPSSFFYYLAILYFLHFFRHNEDLVEFVDDDDFAILIGL